MPKISKWSEHVNKEYSRKDKYKMSPHAIQHPGSALFHLFTLKTKVPNVKRPNEMNNLS